MTQGHPKPWLAKAGWQNGFRCTPCLNRIAANKCVASSMLASVGSMRTAGLADSIDNLPKSSHFFFRRRATATKCSCPIFALPLVVRRLFDHDEAFTGVQRVWPLVGVFKSPTARCFASSLSPSVSSATPRLLAYHHVILVAPQVQRRANAQTQPIHLILPRQRAEVREEVSWGQPPQSRLA